MQGLGNMTLEQVAQTVWTGLQVTVKKHDNLGGYLCVGSKTHGRVLLTMSIGCPAADKADGYIAACQDESRRLLGLKGHISTYQSPNHETPLNPEAIATKDYVLCFVGATRHVNEILIVQLAVGCGLLLPEEAKAIAKISKNPYYTQAR